LPNSASGARTDFAIRRLGEAGGDSFAAASRLDLAKADKAELDRMMATRG
jgi:hypothetical protein